MKKEKRFNLIKLNKVRKAYTMQIWIEEIKSWLALDGFKTKENAERFYDERFTDVESSISCLIKEQNEKEKINNNNRKK